MSNGNNEYQDWDDANPADVRTGYPAGRAPDGDVAADPLSEDVWEDEDDGWDEEGGDSGSKDEAGNDDGYDDETDDEDDHYPADMADKVRNVAVETGVPHDLKQGGSKGAKMLAVLAIAVLGMGISIVGMIIAFGGSDENAESKTPQEEQIANKQRKDFSSETLDMGEESASGTVNSGEVAASAASAVVPAVPAYSASAVVVQPGHGQGGAEDSPHQRKMGGNVLVDLEGGAGATETVTVLSDNSTGLPGAGLPGMGAAEGMMQGGRNNGGSFASRLRPTETEAAQAQQRGSLSLLLTKGTSIPCVLETRIVTTQPGFTRCIVMQDIYSANGKTVLLERGSRITGEQTAALVQGQARVFVLWNEAETPDGVKVSLASPTAGQLGEAGADARVKHHFWKRFGGAILISLIGDTGDYLANRRGNNANGQTFNFDNSSDTAQDLAAEVLKNSINIPPTGYVNQGTVLNVMVARDVDFGGVYEIHPNPLSPPGLPLAY